MRYLNVGDIVRVKEQGIVDAEVTRHQEAIVIYVNRGNITLAFFDWHGGHRGNGPSQYPLEVREFISPNNIWHCHMDEVILIKAVKPITKLERICKKVKYLETRFKERNTPCLAA